MGKSMKIILPSFALLAFLFVPAVGTATDADDASVDEMAAADLESSDELMIGLRAPLTSPLFADTPVAVVDEEPITFSDLTKRIASIHAGKADEATAARKDYASLLDRVITMKLIVQEARNIGLDELPEVESQIDQFSTQLLAASLMSPQLETVEADPEEVEELYRKLARELLVTALRFKREADALAFQKEYQSGAEFSSLAARFIEAGRAEGEIDGQQYMKLKDLLPQIAQAAYEMDEDSLSPIFEVEGGFLVFYLDDMRFYEDATVQEEARERILTPLRKKKADEYIDYLIRQHATVDRGLVDEVDFEKQTTGFLWSREERPVDFAKLLKDDRVLATVHGDEPSVITVGDLAEAVQRRRFHGVEEAAKKGILNKEKWPVLRDMLFRSILKIEAARQGKDGTEEYLNAVEDYTDTVLFDTFVKRILTPDVRVTEQEGLDYYAEHLDDFSSPTMLRMNGLAFYTVSDAEKALMKLRRGADFKWVSANSPGQVDKETERMLRFESALLSLTALPEGLQKAAEGAREGDSFLYSSPQNHHYVIAIEKVFPAEPQPYEKARQSIAAVLFEEQMKDLIEEWSAKLREAYETRIFVTDLDD